MKRLFIGFFILLCSFYASPIYFKNIEMKDGLAQLSTMSIYQDNLGQMWFGSEEGISMYNGYRTISYKPSISVDPNHPIGNINISLTGDSDGNIFFISDNQLVRFSNKTQIFTTIKDGPVYALANYKDHFLVGTVDSVFSYYPSTGEMSFLLNMPPDTPPARRLFIDSQNRIWIGTATGLLLQRKDKSFETILGGCVIAHIFEDSHQNIWIATKGKGVLKVTSSGSRELICNNPKDRNSLSSNEVRMLEEDNLGNIWIGTFNGLNKYSPSENKFTLYTADSYPGTLKNNSIFSVYKDKQGTIWVGSYYGGVNYFNPETDAISYYYSDKLRNDCLSFPIVGRMVEDEDNNLWICTEGGGLNKFDRRTKTFTHFVANDSGNSIIHNNLKGIAYSQSRNKLYIGTHKGGLSIYDITTGKFRNIILESYAYKEMAGDVVNQVALYQDKYLILLTQKGVLKMDIDSETITPFSRNNSLYYGYTFTIDKNNNLWLSEFNSLLRLNLLDESDLEHFYYSKKGLGRFYITQIAFDSKGRLLLGTKGSGLYVMDKDSAHFHCYSTENSLIQSNYCFDIVTTGSGVTIVSGDNGLTFFDPDMNIIKTIGLGNSIPLSGINYGCGMLASQSGEVFVGGVDGLISFYEKRLFTTPKDYDIFFSGLQINNEQIKPGDQSRVLKESLPYQTRIDLKHHQNNLILTFTANNYTGSHRQAIYEYKLEGFDNKWISTTENNLVYTNLSPGKYRLTVREKQYELSTNLRQTSFEIVIHPPLYATFWAYLLYAAIVLGSLYSFYRFKKARIMLHASLEIERKEKEQVKELNRLKQHFFSNISHELRTPLTLIISQMELIMNVKDLPAHVYKMLVRTNNNAHHTRSLINELLDHNKYEDGNIRLSVREQDLVPFIRGVYESFQEHATLHSIQYKLFVPDSPVLCWYDVAQLQKVFYNLLSNAFKFTSKSNSTIEVFVEQTEHEVLIKFVDNGIGIPQKEIELIFERFYQASTNHISKTVATLSTGIGLSLSKQIVELHHGRIEVKSSPDYGSIFTVHLKLGKAHFGEEEIGRDELFVPEEPASYIPSDSLLAFEEESLDSEVGDKEKPTILLVEDQEELLEQLQALFLPAYQVLTACNGREGFAKALKGMPDLIVSDVKMPEMTGIELCSHIKSNFNTCHIPFVLLTAFSSTENTITGLQHGADDYISKPFVPKVLLTKCNNLIRNRIILKKKFNNDKDFNLMSLAENSLDQKLLNSVNSIIEKNLSNPEFGMNSLARELGLSRSSLFTKFKALTGKTPNEYVMTYKLRLAVEWLENEPDVQVADISYKLGFSSPRYFTRCFKEQYQMIPKDVKKKRPVSSGTENE